MTVVRYSGPQRYRDIMLAEGRTVRVKRDKTAKVPEDVAKSLVRQRHFSRVSEQKKSAASPSSRKEQ